MNHYNYQKRLEELWRKAVELYKKGQRGSASFFSPQETQWLADNGVTPQEIYDFAEDYSNYGEPDFITFATITDVRRTYFLKEMGGRSTGRSLSPDRYPPKTEEVEGIVWLPRLIEKAKAKLRGELDLDTMYDCGGDRKFFKTHDIVPAEFLRQVADHIEDDRTVIEWVKERSPEFKAVHAPS